LTDVIQGPIYKRHLTISQGYLKYLEWAILRNDNTPMTLDDLEAHLCGKKRFTETTKKFE